MLVRSLTLELVLEQCAPRCSRGECILVPPHHVHPTQCCMLFRRNLMHWNGMTAGGDPLMVVIRRCTGRQDCSLIRPISSPQPC